LLILATDRAFETAILVSGDKDYLETVKAVKNLGMRIEIVSWRASLSLIEITMRGLGVAIETVVAHRPRTDQYVQHYRIQRAASTNQLQ